MVIILSVGLITPFVTLMSYSDDIRTMGTIFGEVRAILDAPEMVRPEDGKAPDNNDLELKDVHFSYHTDTDKEVLHGVSMMIQEGSFFAFCGEENRRRFHQSILLGVLQAIFEALKIPAIACMVRALLRGSVITQDILLALGIMLFSIIGSSLVKARSMMLQTEGGYDTCAKKRVEIAEHMRYLPMGYFNEKSLGQITSVTTNVMQNLENVATRVIMMVCEGLLTTSLIIVMLLFF